MENENLARELREMETRLVDKLATAVSGIVSGKLLESEERLLGKTHESEERLLGKIHEGEEALLAKIHESEEALLAKIGEGEERLLGKIRDIEERLTQKILTNIRESEEKLTQRIRDIETDLLTAFHGYGHGQTARMHTLDVATHDLSLRISAVEERLLNLETHRR